MYQQYVSNIPNKNYQLLTVFILFYLFSQNLLLQVIHEPISVVKKTGHDRGMDYMCFKH